jgi:hypothetical protein
MRDGPAVQKPKFRLTPGVIAAIVIADLVLFGAAAYWWFVVRGG